MAGRRRNTTIYENSSTIAVNLVRTSSLALAKMTLGRGREALVPSAGLGDAAELPSLTKARPTVSKRQVEPERHAVKYIMEPDTGDVVKPAAGDGGVDAQATAYINRFHTRINSAKNHGDHSGASREVIRPSPPPPPMPKYATAF